MSSLQDLLLAAKGQTATETESLNQTANQAAAQLEVQIQDNPLYQILHEDAEDSEIIQKVAEALARDPELSREDNLQKIKDFALVNKHFQDQMISLAQRLAEFSNDEALSLYDDTVTKLQERLVNFGNDIGPLVRALQVIKEAEEQGKDPQDIINEVLDLRARGKELGESIAAGEESIAQGKAGVENLAEKARDYQGKIESENEQIQGYNDQIAEIKSGVFKGFFSKGKIADIEESKEWKESNVERYTTTLETTAKQLAQKEQEQAELESSHALEVAEYEKLQGQLTDDADIRAISTLIEITGTEYKGRRDDLVGNAKSFIDEAIQEFNSCIKRFEDLEVEIDDFSDVSTNLVQKYFLVISGAEKAYKETDAQLLADQERAKELEATESELDLDIDSPELAKLKVELQDTKDFLNTYLPTRDSAVRFRSILAERQGEFTGLKGLVQSKRHDAEELRTNGAVAVASQLVMTLKSLEAAVAGQKTDTMRSMLQTFSATARSATENVLDSLVKDQDKKNSRLVDALQGMVDMKTKLDKATDDLLKSRTDEAGLTEAVVEATDRVVDSAQDLQDTVSNARRLGKEQVTPEAAKGIVDTLEDAAARKQTGTTPTPM